MPAEAFPLVLSPWHVAHRGPKADFLVNCGGGASCRRVPVHAAGSLPVGL